MALTAAGSILVWMLADELCGGRFGLKFCAPPILEVLLISIVPLALLRTLVVIEFARGRELLLLWLVVPAVAFAIDMWALPAGMSMLAGRFAVFSILTFAFFAGICLLAHIWRRRLFAR